MVNHIIVQAGGKGTRLQYLTDNKPKALVPVENLPVLFHLFRKFSNKNFFIIADYKKDVLKKYLECFADVKYQVVDAEGTGTCSGVKTAISLLPDHEPFLLIWSDLILSDEFEIPNVRNNYVGISQTFPCRWKFDKDEFVEEKSKEYGVAGLFLFKDKACLKDVPQSGEFVRWLSGQNMKFEPLGLAGSREIGTIEEYEKFEATKTRPFNKISISGDIVVKEPIDEQGSKLAKREKKWYQYATNKGISSIPEIYSYEPLTMEKIHGKNIYEIEANKEILLKIVNSLKELHSVYAMQADSLSVKDAYFTKTMNRLEEIRKLVPFADKRIIKINGRECRNVFFYMSDFQKLLEKLECNKFAFIHGDCTFSNILLRHNGEPVFIDPRGYFGQTELYGDPNYDWAKLYYSLVGNYDQFNLKRFRLKIFENNVELEIRSNGWEHLASDFFSFINADVQAIKLIHAIIWLSLTTYAWQDYDSICGAFYNGLHHLEECWA